MGSEHLDVASLDEIQPMLLALRSVTWPVRAQLLLTLLEADLRLWLRCVTELGPDEVLFSGMVVSDAADVVTAIPLTDGSRALPRFRLRVKTRPLPYMM